MRVDPGPPAGSPAGGDGRVVVVGSIAGVEVYPGGAGYTAAKHAANALARTLRLELLADGIRVSEVAPGLVETEFSLVRFDGDAENRLGVPRDDAAHRRRRRRPDRLRRHPPAARRHRLRLGEAHGAQATATVVHRDGGGRADASPRPAACCLRLWSAAAAPARRPGRARRRPDPGAGRKADRRRPLCAWRSAASPGRMGGIWRAAPES